MDFCNTLEALIFAGTLLHKFRVFLAIFATLNTRNIFLDVKFTKTNSPKIFLQLKLAKINTREKKLSLSGREDKKDITFKIPRIYFQNLIGYNCITSFVFLSKHVSNVSWPNLHLLFILCHWRRLTRRTLVGSHEIILTDDRSERSQYLFIFWFEIDFP